MNRIRVGCAVTVLIATMYAAAALFDSLTQFGIAVVIAMLGVIGYGLVDHLDYQRAERLRQYRAEVWHRRDRDAMRQNRMAPSIYTRPRDGQTYTKTRNNGNEVT